MITVGRQPTDPILRFHFVIHSTTEVKRKRTQRSTQFGRLLILWLTLKRFGFASKICLMSFRWTSGGVKAGADPGGPIRP